MKRDTRVTLDVMQFWPVRFAVDQHQRSIPEKPDRHRLRRPLLVDGGEPDDRFFEQTAFYPPLKRIPAIEFKAASGYVCSMPFIKIVMNAPSAATQTAA